MMVLKNMILLISLLLVCAGMASGIESSATREPFGIIRGIVLPPESNATVYAAYTGLEKPYSTKIDSEGNYAMVLPVEIYTLLIVGEGEYVNGSLWNIPVQENEVTILNKINLSRINYTGSISGHVDPVVEGIAVWVNRRGNHTPVKYGFVDESGYYEINGIDPGLYEVTVKFNETQKFYYYNYDLDIHPAEHISNIDLRFTPYNKVDNWVCLTDRVSVRFYSYAGEKDRERIIQACGGSSMLSPKWCFRGCDVLIPKNETVDTMVKRFMSDPLVWEAEPTCIMLDPFDEGLNFDVYLPAKINVPPKTKVTEPKQVVPKNESLPEEIIPSDISNDSTPEKNTDINTLINETVKFETKENKSFVSRVTQFFKSLFKIE